MRRNATTKRSRTEYPFLAFRPTPLLEKRLRTLAGKSGQSISEIIKECVSAHITTLESASKREVAS